MGFNPETGFFEQSASTIIDSTPDGDTVKEGFNERNSPAITELYNDLNTMFKMGVTGVPDGTTIIQNEGALKVNITSGIDENRQSTIMSTSENDVVDYTAELRFYRYLKIGERYSGSYSGSDKRIIIADGTNIDLIDYPEVLEKITNGDLPTTSTPLTHLGLWSQVVGTVYRRPNFINRYVKHTSNVGFAQECGLPNITGNAGGAGHNIVNPPTLTGAFYSSNLIVAGAHINGSGNYGSINFDASRSNSAFGRYETVETDNIQQLPLIYMGKYTGE